MHLLRRISKIRKQVDSLEKTVNKQERSRHDRPYESEPVSRRTPCLVRHSAHNYRYAIYQGLPTGSCDNTSRADDTISELGIHIRRLKAELPKKLFGASPLRYNLVDGNIVSLDHDSSPVVQFSLNLACVRLARLCLAFAVDVNGFKDNFETTYKSQTTTTGYDLHEK
jgi:hypothetical protein